MGEWKSVGRASGSGAFKTLNRASGSGAWKTLDWETAYEDFTTFTEVDIGANRIQKTALHIDHYARRDETTYLYKDYGAAHFSNFTHKIKVKEIDNDDNSAWGIIWMLANNVGNSKALRDANQSHLNIRFYRSGPTWYIDLLEIDSSGNEYNDRYPSMAEDTWYYIKIVKNGTSLSAYIYSDSTYTTLVDTLTLTLQADYSFRYLYGCNTYNSARDSYLISDIENFDLGE